MKEEMDSYDALFKGALPKRFEQARELKKDMTKAEKLLWQELRGRKLDGLKFRRQHPFENYILDFYCAEKKLVIELDGAVHDNDIQKVNDKMRTARLTEFGLKIIRFTNAEVLADINNVLNKILSAT